MATSSVRAYRVDLKASVAKAASLKSSWYHMVEFIPKCPLISLLAFSVVSSDVSKASRSVLSGPFEPNKTQKREKQTEWVNTVELRRMTEGNDLGSLGMH